MKTFSGTGEDRRGPVGPYYGQPPPGEKAVMFAPGIVSIERRYEYALSVSPDGKEILFSAEVPDQPSAVYHCRIENGRWSMPEKVSLSGGKKKSEMEAFFTPDGRRIYFAPFDEGMDVRIWVVDRTKQGQFLVYWAPGEGNLGDYFSKHHPASHHRAMRPSTFIFPRPKPFRRARMC